MTIRTLFVTRLYEAMIDHPELLSDLEHSVRLLAEEDRAGRNWSKSHGYRGYTSYASLADLPQRSPAFAELATHLDRHVAAFANAVDFDLDGRRLKLDSMWLNVMQSGAVHTAHIHPKSVVSGTYYVAVPPGAGALKLEDPRLGLMMAAPPRKARAAR